MDVLGRQELVPRLSTRDAVPRVQYLRDGIDLRSWCRNDPQLSERVGDLPCQAGSSSVRRSRGASPRSCNAEQTESPGSGVFRPRKVSTTSPLSKAAFGKTGPSSDWSSGAWYLSHRLRCADVTSSETHKKWQAPHRSARFSCDFFLAMFTARVVRARGSAAVIERGSRLHLARTCHASPRT